MLPHAGSLHWRAHRLLDTTRAPAACSVPFSIGQVAGPQSLAAGTSRSCNAGSWPSTCSWAARPSVGNSNCHHGSAICYSSMGRSELSGHCTPCWSSTRSAAAATPVGRYPGYAQGGRTFGVQMKSSSSSSSSGAHPDTQLSPEGPQLTEQQQQQVPTPISKDAASQTAASSSSNGSSDQQLPHTGLAEPSPATTSTPAPPFEVQPALTQQQQQPQELPGSQGGATPAAATAATGAAAAATQKQPEAGAREQHRHKRRLPRPPSPQQVLQMFPPSARPSPALAAFLGGGLLVAGLLLRWAAGTPMRRSHPYTMHISFAQASKIEPGTPVRMKGVQIGVIHQVDVYPSQVDVVAEVQDAQNVIPLGSRVDINQLGLAADPWVDITPAEGCRVNPKVGPHHPKCREEGLIVCDGQRVPGSQGGSMDYMMKSFLRYQDISRTKTITDAYRDP